MFKKKTYSNESSLPFKLSRTKIDLYFECKRCFFLDQKHGVRRPHGTPLVLNNKIVDDFKKELNDCRKQKTIHSKVRELNKNFIPTSHPKFEEWKSPFKGTNYLHKDTNFLICGIIDDIWWDRISNKNHSVIIKTTSKNLNYDSIWNGYWRQLSLYSYLLSKNSLSMAKTGIIIFINVITKMDEVKKNSFLNLNIFEKILDFDWIEPTIKDIYSILNNIKPPEGSKKCKYCNYYFNIRNLTNE